MRVIATCSTTARRASRRPTSVPPMRYRPVIVIAAAVVILSGCDLGLATRGGLVVNKTRQDLMVEPVGVSDASRATIPAERSHGWNAFNTCLGTGLAVFTPDGERLATLDRRICDGERFVIEPDDLPSSER